MAAFTKSDAPPAWTTFEGYDEAGGFEGQPSVEVLGEEEGEGEYDDDYTYNEADGDAAQVTDLSFPKRLLHALHVIIDCCHTSHWGSRTGSMLHHPLCLLSCHL